MSPGSGSFFLDGVPQSSRLRSSVAAFLAHAHGTVTIARILSISAMPSNLRFLYDVDQIIPGTNYKVLAHLGIGGMGSVYEIAEPTRDDQPFVLKAVHPQLLAGTRVRERLFKESAALRQLQHENIVRILGSGETGSDPAIPYYLMERLRGHTLGRALRRLRAKGRWLPLSRAFTIMAGVLSALAYAHEHGVIHRDVKAENIFLHQRSDGRICIKLVDFGATRIIGDARATPFGIAGSVASAAPELLRSEEATPACDIYAAGVLLYEMLCWHHPFGEFSDDRELVEAHLSSNPVPLSTWRAVPQALDELILRMLEKDPKKRPDGAAALSSLDRIRRELSRTNTLELYDPPSAKMPIAPIVLPPAAPAPVPRPDVWESPTGHIVSGPAQSPADLERAELASVPPGPPEAAPPVRLTPYMAADGSVGIRAGAAVGSESSSVRPGKSIETPAWGSGPEGRMESAPPAGRSAPPVPASSSVRPPSVPPRPAPSVPPTTGSLPSPSPSPPRAAPPPPAPSVPILPEPEFDNGPATDPSVAPLPAAVAGASSNSVADGSAGVRRESLVASAGADTEVSRPRRGPEEEDADAAAVSPAEQPPASSPSPPMASSSPATLPRNRASSRGTGKARWWLHPDANQPVPDWVQAAAESASSRARLPLALKKAAASVGMGVTLSFLVLAPTSGLWWPSQPMQAGAGVPGLLAAPPAPRSPVALGPVEVHSQQSPNAVGAVAATANGAGVPLKPPSATSSTVSGAAVLAAAEARASKRAAEPRPASAAPAASVAPHASARDPGQSKSTKVVGRELLDLP